MTIETILLYILSVMFLWAVFIGPNGVEATFQGAGPKLGYKIEKHIEVGSGFVEASKNATSEIRWTRKRGGTYKVEGLND
tara:strand:+ start:5026 stop:5265 length:240 start_codon:yes stop_codon:yes gene_type:complete